MKRRVVLKQIAGATGISILLPGCWDKKRVELIHLNTLKVDNDQKDLIDQLSKTLIPDSANEEVDTMHYLFVLTMVDDCYTEEEQKKFVSGLEAFEANTRKQFNKTFVHCNTHERRALLQHIEETKKEENTLNYFYSTVKNLTIQSFTTSELFLTSVQGYRLVPGYYFGCLPVNNVHS